MPSKLLVSCASFPEWCVCVLFCTVRAVKGSSHSFLPLYIASLQGYAVIGSVWVFKGIHILGSFGPQLERGCDLFKGWRQRRKEKGTVAGP